MTVATRSMIVPLTVAMLLYLAEMFASDPVITGLALMAKSTPLPGARARMRNMSAARTQGRCL